MGFGSNNQTKGKDGAIFRAQRWVKYQTLSMGGHINFSKSDVFKTHWNYKINLLIFKEY